MRSVVRDRAEVVAAVEAALALDDSVLVEGFVRGREIDVAVIEHADGRLECGPLLEIGVPDDGIFDTAGKYDSEPDFRIPAAVSASERAALEEAAEHVLPVADGLAEAVRPRQLAEQVARDEQDIDPLALAVRGDALDRGAQVRGPVDATQPVAQVPVGRVENLHTPVLCRGLRMDERSDGKGSSLRSEAPQSPTDYHQST